MDDRQKGWLSTRDVVTCLLVVMVAMNCIGMTAAGSCLRSERLVGGQCEECPTCAPGSGLNKDCGHGRGVGARCAPCQPGFYNPPPGGATCLVCTNCSVFHRQEAFRCRSVIDAECGTCLEGFYDEETSLMFGGGFISPCESCQHYPDHPQCRQTRPQVVAPVTIRLQAEVQAAPDASSDETSGPPTTLLTVILGGMSLLTVIVLAILLLRHRRTLHRRMRNTDLERPVTSPEDGRANRGYASSHSVQGPEDNALLPEPSPHRHGRECMIPARQAAAWCPGLVLRPEPETLHRKRGLESGPSSAEEGEEGWGEEQTLLSESIQNRKRPRVTEVCSGRGPDDASLKLILRPRDLENLVTSNNPHLSERFDAMAAGTGGQKHQDDVTESEGEDEDDGLPGDANKDIPMEEDIESGGTSGTMDTGDGPSRGDREAGRGEDMHGNDDEDDLQQYGACALPRHYVPPPDESAWSYVDFHGLMTSSRSPEACLEDLDLDLNLNLNDGSPSPGSSGNISQASTVLIRGISRSPISSLHDDDSTLDALDNLPIPGDGLPSSLPVSNEGPFHFLSSLSNHSLVTEAPTANIENNPPPLNTQNQMSTETGEDVTDALVPSSMTLQPQSPLPRLSSFPQSFTGSRGELADSAETETESIPRTVEILDEERYAQALRLAKDRLVAELDYDVSERLAAALHPRPLPGDHNARHLGAALGVPPEVLTGVHTFDEVLAHLRRRRVTIVVLLKAVRALGRMDVVYLLSQWILGSFSAPPSDGANYVSPPVMHLVVPETQGPLAEESGEQPTLSVQETGE